VREESKVKLKIKSMVIPSPRTKKARPRAFINKMEAMDIFSENV
jgi:hypothetical protein